MKLQNLDVESWSPFKLGHSIMTDNPSFPELTSSTVIGISVAIAGNVLISLALNLQKLAHRRVEAKKLARAREKSANRRRAAACPSLNEYEEDTRLDSPSNSVYVQSPNDIYNASSRQPTTSIDANETEPLLTIPVQPSSSSDLTQRLEPTKQIGSQQSNRWLLSRFFSRGSTSKPALPAQHSNLPVDVVNEDTLASRRPSSENTAVSESPENIEAEGNETDYLKTKLWWLGFALMNVGEIGNFISYAFAPASVVAPLGTFALIANGVFAPLMLGERFRKRDLVGMLIAITGAITVVLSSNASDVRLDPDALIKAISQKPFLVYSGLYIGGAIVLSTLSEGKLGRQYVFVDVGLCALFGGFTVLSTKAVSTLLTLQWIEMFRSWITYPAIAVLVLTGVGQVRYLNRALMRFDSKVVIPSQFVLFNLSVIIGSALLYGDFKRATFHQLTTFLYGCAATFAGVFIIAWNTNGENLDGSDEQEEEEELRPGHQGEPQVGFGSIGRRNRATLVLPAGVKPAPILRNKRSSISMMGISPGQHLLLVHTPPHERARELDLERGAPTSPDSVRQRQLSNPPRRVGTRESSIVGRN